MVSGILCGRLESRPLTVGTSPKKKVSAELTGGAGFTYEANVAAHYLAALLTEGSAEGLPHRVVRRVALQQSGAGEPLDDVIVDAAGAADDMRLSLQVKRELVISSAAKNTDFREIVVNSWKTLQKPGFRDGVDRYGAATGTVSSKRLRELRRVCEVARSSLTADTFLARGEEGGNAGKSFNGIVGDFRKILTDNGMTVSDLDLHRLLKHFVLIRFDFLAEEAAHPPQAVDRLRGLLPDGDALRAAELWQHLVGIGRDGAGLAAEYDRDRLLALLTGSFRLLPAPSSRADLQLLAQFSEQGIDSVASDIGGVHLARPGFADQVRQLLEKHRYVQIQGLPGTGKSVLLRELALQHCGCGAILFLRSDRLHGNSWAEFAAALGLTNKNLSSLLADLAASGPPILFLDGIDRIGGPQRNIIIDLLNAMFSATASLWKVVATLRDTGIEPLRNWLPTGLTDAHGAGSVSVSSLNDEEAQALAHDMPSLRPLLLGNLKVRDIARRPFFAAVLVKAGAVTTGNEAFAPQSETDLMREWWRRGGYGADASAIFPRQRALLEIARNGVRRMGINITLAALSAEAAAQLASLIDDGIIQQAGDDRFKFAHDIFFEWAFYHELRGQEDGWISTLAAIGEPPVLGRVVELLGQASFANGTWSSGLMRIEASSLRSQWRRAWLLAPLASPEFEDHLGDFESVISADDYNRLGQLLVWFQAERTTPNTQFLSGERLASPLPTLEAIRYADRFGWPSDARSWRRLIDWAIDRETRLPARLIPDLLSVFEVWQNPFAGFDNPTSRKIVTQCLAWLADIEERQHPERWSGDFGRWKDLLGDDLNNLERSLRELVLYAARAYPDLVRGYLHRLADNDRVRQHAFSTVIAYSPLLAQVCPNDIVDLVRAEILELLPKDQLAEWEEEQQQRMRDLRRAREIPERERSKFDRLMLASPPHIASDLSHHDWHRLSLNEHSGEYFPASPLREPFPSLFRHAPQQASALVRMLSNHAITAWRQLHEYTDMGRGTPLPLDLQFPWAKQTFWGDQPQYEWYRGRLGVEIVESGLMALEQWAFDQLAQGQPVDDVVQAIVEGHDGWAVLGIAVGLCLEKQHVSPVSAVLLGCQRLWKADITRQMNDEAGHQSNLMGFGGIGGLKSADRPHLNAVREGNQRDCRKWTLRDLTPLHVLAPDPQVRTTVREALAGFPENLPFAYEEERHHPKHVADLRTTAEIWAEWGRQENYKASAPEPSESKVLIELDNPRSKAPDVQEALARSAATLQQHSLWVWVDLCFQNAQLMERFSVEEAVQIAMAIDRPDLFGSQSDDDMDMTPAAVAGVAAVIKCFVDDPPPAWSTWASDVVSRFGAAPMPDLDSWSSRSAIPWHPGVSVARALAGDIRRGLDPENTAKVSLYALCAHPLETVSLAAFAAATSCWNHDPRFSWIALDLGTRLARGIRRIPTYGQPDDASSAAARIDDAVSVAQQAYEHGSGYPEISLPASPWTYAPPRRSFGIERAGESESVWQHSDDYWRSEFAAEILEGLPITKIMSIPDRRDQFLRLLDGLLAWTVEYLSPPWDNSTDRKRNSKSELGTWVARFSGLLARAAEQLKSEETIPRYLQPIFDLDDELSASFMSPFVSRISAGILDEEEISADALTLLSACTDRIVADGAFYLHRYRGEVYGHDLPVIIRSLLFVAITDAGGARRFANGDWKDIAAVLPIIDKLVRAIGWMPFVAGEFVKLCESCGESYPTEAFADQILHILGSDSLPGWRNTTLPSRIAGQIQVRADRGAPLSPALAQKLLRVLDLLVDMGDRRSAALQISDAFRDVRVQV